MTGKVLRSILSVAVTVLLVSFVFITGMLYDYFGDIQVAQLKDELSLAAAATEQQGEEYLKKLNSEHYRLTLISSNGAVLYDTQVEATRMENHADREEIKEALENGTGSSLRHSSTLTENTLYEAVQLSDGTVLRISVSQTSAVVLVLGMLQPIVIIVIIAVIVSAVIASRMAKRITEPLNRLDLEHPLENDVYEELSPLLNRIHQQHGQIKAQMRDLKQKRDEFSLVTESMKEGLVLLDTNSRILSMNSAAIKIFDADVHCVGQDFLTVERRLEVSRAIEKALLNGHCETEAEKQGIEYRFVINRIESQGETVGAVLLAFDITEQAKAERSRREFSANVSHELKTPLQGIIGSAELLKNGLVKPEDTSRFIGHIHSEATRLVTLVEDIIRLSQLDENTEMPKEEVSLYKLTEEAFSSLEEIANQRDIKLTVRGDSSVCGVKRLLSEVIFNLCDNAVKYNVDGGSVDVNITDNKDNVVLSVADTGIGIPSEHQSRIFERFYRVDKSHSKKSGGTGLGLSIVKHAVSYHGGAIELSSNPDKGTTITVTLPKK